ncbi:protein unc-93 homolog A-like [Glandiceps talaboti]
MAVVTAGDSHDSMQESKELDRNDKESMTRGMSSAVTESEFMLEKGGDTHRSDFDSATVINKNSLWRNALCLSLSFCCTLSAFFGLRGLQSSINCIEGLGFASLVTLYISSLFAGLFLASFLTEWLGNKRTLILSPVCFVIYTAANFYPHWYTMIPASIVVGVGTALIWTAQPSCLTTVGQLLAKITGKSTEIMVNKVMSIFCLFFNVSTVIAYILPAIIYGGFNDPFTNQTSKLYIDSYTCGASDCQQTEGNVTTYCNPPDKHLTYILLGIYMVLGLAAVGIVIFFVDDLQSHHALNVKTRLLEKAGATIRLWSNYKMLLIMPHSLYIGLNLTFIYGDFTKSYITCGVGLDMVGYIFVCSSTIGIFAQLPLSRMGKTHQRVILMSIAFICLLSCYILLLVMEPADNTLTIALMFLISVLWGVADSIMLLESTTIHALVFPNKKEGAFANRNVWKAIGFSIGFALSLFLCVYIKILILIVLLVISFTLYFILEFIFNKESNSKSVSSKSAEVNIDTETSI